MSARKRESSSGRRPRRGRVAKIRLPAEACFYREMPYRQTSTRVSAVTDSVEGGPAPVRPDDGEGRQAIRSDLLLWIPAKEYGRYVEEGRAEDLAEEYPLSIEIGVAEEDFCHFGVDLHVSPEDINLVVEWIEEHYSTLGERERPPQCISAAVLTNWIRVVSARLEKGHEDGARANRRPEADRHAGGDASAL